MADFKETLRLDSRWVDNLLAILGCLPSESGQFNMFHMYVALGLTVFGTMITFTSVYSAWPDNIEECSYNITPFLASALSVIKFCNFMAHRKEFFVLMKTVKERFCYDNMNSPVREQEIILRYSRYVRVGCLAHLAGMSSAVPLWMFKPLVEMLLAARHSDVVIKTLPFKVWIPGFSVSSNAMFVLMYVLQLVSSFLNIIGLAALDGLYLHLVLHTCAQFKLIQGRTKNFNKTETESEYSIYEQEKKIWKIVEYHQDLLSVCKKIADLESVHVLMQFIVAILFLCFAGIVATMFPGNIMIYLLTTLCIVTAVIENFLHCFPGTMLTTESFGVALAAYDSDWYHAPIHIQKQLMFIIARAQRPVVLTIGKLIPVSLESFEMILRTAASYFTVLQSAQEET